MAALIHLAIAMDERQRLRIYRKYLRDNLNSFDIGEARFKELYRFPIYLAVDLIEEIRQFYDDTVGEIPLHIKVLSALNFYASGSYQRRVGQDSLSCVSQTVVSRIIKQITGIIVNQLLPLYISFPADEEEMVEIQNRFFVESGYPYVIGLIDGTHIGLSAVPRDVENGYVNHKGFHSINVQLIVDYDMKILNINARFPGSTHDSYIWRNSKVFHLMEQLYRDHPNVPHYILGDGGYPLQPFLMVPFKNPVTNEQRVFNEHHAKLRVRVELTIGRFKNVFRCLSKEKILRYKPHNAAMIINACATLRNFLLVNGITDEEFDGDFEEIVDVPHNGENNYLQEGQIQRNLLVQYFAQNN